MSQLAASSLKATEMAKDEKDAKFAEACAKFLSRPDLEIALQVQILFSADPTIKKVITSLLNSIQILKSDKVLYETIKQISPDVKPGAFLSALFKKNDDTMNVADKPSDDLAKLQQLKGPESVVFLRDLFSRFEVAVTQLLTPQMIELDQSEWEETIRNWSQGDHENADGIDLEYFLCMKMFDKQIKRWVLCSFLYKKDIDDLDDFMEMLYFSNKWSKLQLASEKDLSLGMYYTENEVNTEDTHTSEAPTTEFISSSDMYINAEKIAIYLSKLSS